MKSLCEFHINIPNEVFDSYLKDKKICKFKEDGFEMPYYVIKQNEVNGYHFILYYENRIDDKLICIHKIMGGWWSNLPSYPD